MGVFATIAISASSAAIATPHADAVVAATSCEIRYAFDAAGLERPIVDAVHAAFASVAEASGTSAVHVPSEADALVRVSVASAEGVPTFAQLVDVVGLAAHSATDTTVVVQRGEVQLRAGSSYLSDPVGMANLVSHELGHLAGLAHRDDPTSLMYPTVKLSVPQTWSDGDRALLRAAGVRAGCHR